MQQQATWIRNGGKKRTHRRLYLARLTLRSRKKQPPLPYKRRDDRLASNKKENAQYPKKKKRATANP